MPQKCGVPDDEHPEWTLEDIRTSTPGAEVFSPGWQRLMHDTLAAHAPRQSRGTGVRRAGRPTATPSSPAPVRARAKH